MHKQNYNSIDVKQASTNHSSSSGNGTNSQ